MLTTLKTAHVAHLVAAKVLSSKVIVGVGMVAGAAAAGFVSEIGLPADYTSSMMELINQSVQAEMPAALPTSGASASSGSHGGPGIDGAEALQDIPQMVIVGRRLNRDQKAQYDADRRGASQMAQH
ncbi:MAG: hypothetical protein H7327_10205 [Herminiimonas sp.]|nr:hypothetical protein [Herminiimonas sp.]